MSVMTWNCGSGAGPGDEEDNSPKHDETTTDPYSEQTTVLSLATNYELAT